MLKRQDKYLMLSKAILEILKHQTAKLDTMDYLTIFYNLSEAQTKEQLGSLVAELTNSYPFLEEVDLEFRNISSSEKEEALQQFIASLIKAGDLETAQEFAAKATNTNVTLEELMQNPLFEKFINSQ